MNDMLDLARRQGYVSAADAKALGHHRQELTRLTRAGELRRSVRGIYLPLPDNHTRETRHALVTRGILDGDPFSAASHHSALAVHGINLYGVPWSQIHLLDPRKSSKAHETVHRHVLRPGDQIVTVDRHRVAALPLALCQVAARFGLASGLVAMDHALHRGLVTTDELSALLQSGRLRRGVRSARRAVELADGRAESPGESRLRAIVAAGPFSFDPQVNVGGPGSGHRVDLLIDGRVALEFDGEQKYEGIEGKKALVDEKRREDWIRSQGYGFVRVMWAELDHPATLRHVIHKEVLQSRVRRAA